MDAEKAWRSGAANDDGATRSFPPCTTPQYLVPSTASVMTLDTCDDRTAGAAIEKAENPTDSYEESFVNCSDHAQWVSLHLPTLYIKGL
jgi:hypothetical protein